MLKNLEMHGKEMLTVIFKKVWNKEEVKIEKKKQ